MNKLFLGDCLDVLKTLPDNSIDLIFCSPPYEDCRTYNIGFNLKGQVFVDWCVKRYLECTRVSSGIVAWVIQGKTKNFQWSAAPALIMADLHRSGVKLRNPPIFHRVGIPGSGGPDWLRCDTEFIICSSKGKLPWSDNTALGHPPKWAPGGKMSYRLSDGTRRNQWGGKPSGIKERQKDVSMAIQGVKPSHKIISKKEILEMNIQEYIPPVKANPGNLISCNVGLGHMGSKLAHKNEAPFPEKLVEFFIKSFCPPNGIICDPFVGSGTSIVAAQKLDRKWIGIDIRQSQIDLCIERLKEIRYNYK